MREDLRIGAPVWSAEGERLGRLSRLIVDERLEQVEGLVVESAAAAGGSPRYPLLEGAPTVVVPLAAVARVDERGIHLTLAPADFRALPRYEETHFVRPGEDWTPPPGYLAEHFLVRLGEFFGGGPAVPPVEIERHRRPGTREIAVGTGVWRVNGVHEKIGEVAHVLLDPAGRVTALVLRRGALFAEERVLPVRYVVEVLDDAVRVRIGREELERLERYRE
jgi:sporulation protein YlmC with PRC-barrel domain